VILMRDDRPSVWTEKGRVAYFLWCGAQANMQ